jgi:Putative peptidoglycan binding domain
MRLLRLQREDALIEVARARLACDDLMTVIGSLRIEAKPAPRRCGAVIASVIAVGSLVMGGPAVRADQTVFFDDAGNAPHISLIGDSTMTGVRWYADYGALERFNFVLSAESCRRTIEQSCISREGYRSANVLMAMRTLNGELGEVLVVMSGYNDPIWTIDEAIAGVVEEARSQGVGRVVWLSLRTSDDVDYSDPQEQSSINTFREYNEQLVAAAAASDGYLQVADWATYSNGASAWFEADGVHLTARGVDAITTFIAGMVERVLAGANVSPAAAPWTVLVPGAEGETVAAVQEALIAAGVDVAGGADGVYGNDTMVAVAEYQRRNDALQETGAVDVATAQSLGVYQDPDAAVETTATTVPSATTVVATTVPVPAQAAAIGESTDTTDSDGGGVPLRPLITASVVVALAAAVAGRRRYVVAQRAARRWARVHPATSPRRSVSDMRRVGDLPAATSQASQIYDHQSEQTTAVEAEDVVSWQ